jgi:hypothetical protein
MVRVSAAGLLTVVTVGLIRTSPPLMMGCRARQLRVAPAGKLMISPVVMVDSAVTVRVAFAAAPVVADTIVIV